jgi:hypothetical protein
MRGARLPRGGWATSPLRLFEGHRVQAQLEEGDWVGGVLHVVADGVEILYDEPRLVGGCVESSRILDREAAARLKALVRPAALWTDDLRAARDAQIWRAAHPPWRDRVAHVVRELLRRDPLAAEPLLRRHVGRRILVRVDRRSRAHHVAGLLLGFDRDFLALADAVLPSETCLPLCPGKTLSRDLEVTWNDEGLALFNRGAETVEVLGIRTSAGMRPWEIALRPGFRERVGFRRQPAGTAELVYESAERCDAILARRSLRILGGSEGSVALPALPDPSTLMRDLPIGTTPESREEPPVAASHAE